MISGCSTIYSIPGRVLPPAPEILTPVRPTRLTADMDAVEMLGRRNLDLKEANRRITAGRVWYEGVSELFSEPQQ